MVQVFKGYSGYSRGGAVRGGDDPLPGDDAAAAAAHGSEEVDHPQRHLVRMLPLARLPARHDAVLPRL